MHSRGMEHSTPVSRVTCLYIEGFSPGPGLPKPILARCNFHVVTTRMPYGICDHAQNPFVVLALVGAGTTLWLVSALSTWWQVILALITGGVVCIYAKRRAVGYCLDQCMNAQLRLIERHSPDLVVGYSWGGGIACGLLNRRDWSGPTLLLAPAGEQMWAHAGRVPPTLQHGAIPDSAAVLTVQGDADAIVSLSEVQRLHEGAAEEQCQLQLAPGEDHFLGYTATPAAIQEWSRKLMMKSVHNR